MPTEEELIKERVRKLKDIRMLGINPYPYKYEPKNKASDINSKYANLQKEEHTKDTVNIAGRIVALRRMGKATFMHVKDYTGQTQAYFKEDILGKDKYSFLKLLDRGDWIGVQGTIFKTKTGEVTIEVQNLELLSKSLRPLPEKWHGLKNTELRYRQRYLDLVMNPEVQKVFQTRSKIIQVIRDFFHKQNYLEVETPVLSTVYGGANARPFTTHHHDLNIDLFMRISLELYHKRLIVGGFDRVFEIGHVFRNEGIDRSHNPEFTLLECYRAYADYEEHIAYAIVKHKLDPRITEVQKAREEYLSRKGDNYLGPLPGSMLEARQSIDLICSLGGIPVWAHPNHREYATVNPDKILPLLKKWSDGKIMIEAYTRRLSEPRQEEMAKLAKQHNLMVSYSTDFHGWPYRVKDKRIGKLGKEAPDDFFNKLLEHRDK